MEKPRGRLFAAMFLSNSRRSGDVALGRGRRSSTGVAPLRGPLGFAVRVVADAPPKSSGVDRAGTY